jgi:hypothetical protein
VDLQRSISTFIASGEEDSKLQSNMDLCFEINIALVYVNASIEPDSVASGPGSFPGQVLKGIEPALDK